MGPKHDKLWLDALKTLASDPFLVYTLPKTNSKIAVEKWMEKVDHPILSHSIHGIFTDMNGVFGW